jgi:hypothetical protein
LAVADTCFGHSIDMADYWKKYICKPTKFSCANRLQQAFFGVQEMWQDQAVWYDEHHALGWTGCTLLLLICLYYTQTAYRKSKLWYRRRKRRQYRLFGMKKRKRH